MAASDYFKRANVVQIYDVEISEENEWINHSTGGFDAFNRIWDETNIKRHKTLSADQIGMVNTKATQVLRELNSNAYASFCKCLHSYAAAHPNYNIFQGIPQVQFVRSRYPAELDSLDSKICFTEEWKVPLSALTAFITFAGGAIGAGYLAETKVDNQYVAHLLTATGAVLSGLLGVGVSVIGFDVAKEIYKDQKREIGQRMKLDLAERGKQYLKSQPE